MEELILFTNLRALPAGIFDELTVLTSLDLGVNRLTTLPADIFDELTLLQYIKPSRQ